MGFSLAVRCRKFPDASKQTPILYGPYNMPHTVLKVPGAGRLSLGTRGWKIRFRCCLFMSVKSTLEFRTHKCLRILSNFKTNPTGPFPGAGDRPRDRKTGFRVLGRAQSIHISCSTIEPQWLSICAGNASKQFASKLLYK